MKTNLSLQFPAIHWLGAGVQRKLTMLTIAAFAVALSLTMAAINGYWLWLAGAVGVAGVLWLLALKSTTHLMLVFAFLPFQSLLNDVFAGIIPAIAIAKDGLMLVVLLALVAHHLIRRQAWYINSSITLLLVYAVIGAMCALSSPYLLHGILALRFLTLYPLIILLMANAMETREEVNRLLRVVAIVGVVTVIYGIVQYATLFDVPYRTAGGDVSLRMGRFDEMGAVSTFASRPTFGGYLSPLFLLFLQNDLWRQLWGGKIKAWLRWPMLGAIGVCVILTFSRSSWLALLVGTLVALYFRDKMKAILATFGLGVCGVLFFIVQAVSPSSSLATAATDNESFLIRLSYWPMVARHVLVHPFGIGLGTVGGPHLFEAEAQADIYGNLRYDQNASFDPNAELGPDGVISVTDNSFLKLFIQGGFPLLIAFLCFIGAVIRLARDVLKGPDDAQEANDEERVWTRGIAIWATSSFASLLTIFMFVDFMESAPAIALYWMAIGALCCAKKFSQKGVGQLVTE